MAATIKVLELVGVSERGFDEAAQNAVQEAAKTVRNIHGVDVIRNTAKVRDGKIYEYHCNVKVAFVVEAQ